MDYHHVVEAAGAVALALVFYSYTWRWFDPAESPARARWRPVVNGIAFGLLAVFLMRSRIQVGEDRWVDARAVLIHILRGPRFARAPQDDCLRLARDSRIRGA